MLHHELCDQNSITGGAHCLLSAHISCKQCVSHTQNRAHNKPSIHPQELERKNKEKVSGRRGQVNTLGSHLPQGYSKKERKRSRGVAIYATLLRAPTSGGQTEQPSERCSIVRRTCACFLFQTYDLALRQCDDDGACTLRTVSMGTVSATMRRRWSQHTCICPDISHTQKRAGEEDAIRRSPVPVHMHGPRRSTLKQREAPLPGAQPKRPCTCPSLPSGFVSE